jgi:hypothetical protein
MNKKKEKERASSSSSSRIKPKVLANGQLRCPTGTRRKGKYCVSNTKPEPQPILPEPQSILPEPQSILPEPQPILPEPQSIIPEPQPIIPEPQIEQISGIRHDDILLPKRITIHVPKPKHVTIPAEIHVPTKKETPKHDMHIVKPTVMQNGSLRCPDGTRRTKDGHWCVPKEYINVPYLREIIDEIAKKSQREVQALSPSKTPHAIILDQNNIPIRLDNRMVEDVQKQSDGDVSDQEPVVHQNQEQSQDDLVESLLKMPSPTITLSSIPAQISSEPSEVGEVDYKRLNIFKREKERAENANSMESDFLLPTLNDPKFAERISSHKAFTDTPYDGATHEIEKRSNEMCNVEFGLMPHQSFIRNFMSSETPYNTLLLYHSLGSGKTCSAISVCEEMRDYMKQSGLREKIIVIASPNVQGNFRKQLFDESRLEKVVLNADPEEYTWNIQSCVGNSLLREINPAQIRNYPKEKIVSNIQSLISTYYSFMGYGQFANYVLELSGQYEIANIRRHFNNRLIIIDEVQNIRMTEENTNKEATAAAALLLKVVKHAVNLRLLLLTATPMYNSYKEIVWLTNLMNATNGRSTVEVKDIFDSDGNIKETNSGDNKESGMDLLRRKLTGYVSYVRGENPYAFPFRIYPADFAPERALASVKYPALQMNGKPIAEPMTKMPVYLTRLSRTSQQFMVYDSIINELAIGRDVYTAAGKLKNQLAFDDMDAFGYTTLQRPIEALNIAYPDPTGAKLGLVGSVGLQSVITYDRATKTDFEYLQGAPGRVFSPDQIANYSAKIAEIGQRIRESEGIVIVYSQYIEGGIVPLALAMEELGISRYASTPSTRSLFKQSPLVPPLLTPAGKQAKYIMITGDRQYSPSNNSDMKIVSSGDNKDGDLIKVVLISRAGAEGLDFANVRQLHIMEPWYNMSRMEQIIGRAVRNLSHCKLPFNKRNVQVFLHGTVIDAASTSASTEVESADMYVYRLVEKKMHLIQNVERVMKESAVDCLIHIGQNNYTKSALSKEPKNVDIPIVLSNGKTIKFTPGDEDDTVYECKSTSGETLVASSEPGKTTYSDSMARTNIQYISDRIRQLFRESPSWSRAQLVKAINVKKYVPIEQLFYTLSQFVGNQHNYVIDRYGRFGYIVNHDSYYLFQPMELTDTTISMFERVVPIEYKRKNVSLEVSPEFGIGNQATVIVNENENVSVTEHVNENENVPALQTLEDLFIAAADKKNVTNSNDWYVHAGHVFDHLAHVHSIPIEAQYNYFAHHFLDLMDSHEKQSLVKSLFPARLAIDKNDLFVRAGRSYREPEPTMRDRAISYFAKRMLFKDTHNEVLCLGVNKTTLTILKRGVAAGSEWKTGDRTDLEYFTEEVKSRIHVPREKLFAVIGFSGDFKGKEMVFKLKNRAQKRNNKGANCESAGKVDLIKYANQLLGVEEQYTQENTKTTITKLGMCTIIEFLMRDFTDQKKDKRVYYLGPEQAVEMDIANIT